MTATPPPSTPTAAVPSRYAVAYALTALAAVLLGPVPLAAALSASASNFEGGRGYAFIGYLPIVAGAIVLIAGTLYLWARKRPSRRRAALYGLAGFDGLAAIALIYLLLAGF